MSKLIEDGLYILLTRWLLIPANIASAFLGIITNIANIIIFLKMGVNKDTMTLSLTSLAVSDFIMALLGLASNVINCLIFNGYPVLFRVHLESLIVVAFADSRPAFHKISVMITTLVSFERALCVVKPFLVKRVFTWKRTIVALVFSYLFFIAAFSPANVYGRLTWQYPSNSSSEPILMALINPEKYVAQEVQVLTLGLSFVLLSQVVILVNALVMGVGLKRSQKFRQSSMPLKPAEPSASKTKKGTNNSNNNSNNSSNNSSITTTDDTPVSNSRTPSTREDRLIKTVLILAIIHITLNFPLSVFYIVRPAIPEMAPFKSYHNTYMISIESLNVPQTLNGVFNIFVYLKMNSKFKATFREVFCRS